MSNSLGTGCLWNCFQKKSTILIPVQLHYTSKKKLLPVGAIHVVKNIVFALANASSVSWFNYFTQLWQKLQYLHSHWWWVTINSYEVICVCDKLTPGADQLFSFFVTMSHKLYHPSCHEKLIDISIIIIRFGKWLIPNTKYRPSMYG